MRTTNTLIVGAGQAGLALSRCLTELDRDHLVVDRGRVAERWRSERWDSLRLLTPNWMSRLPGWGYDGTDPDGFMTAAEVAAFFARYARSFTAPVYERTAVERLRQRGDSFEIATSEGEIRADNVVIATGWCDLPAVPRIGRHLSPRITQVTANEYRRPDDLAAGGVLVVGASATGVQLAHELHASGRPVTIAIGSHSRMPRRYRGMDVFWWLDMIRAFDRTVDEVGDVSVARFEPSVQLVGRSDHSTLDLATLLDDGVRLVGRLVGSDGTRVGFETNLDAVLADADRHMAQTLARIDAYISSSGLDREVLPSERSRPVRPPSTPEALDLDAAGITTVVWATGFRRQYDWLDLPVLDERGEIRQRRGVTPVPGAYVLGQRFQHFRNSNFIDGVGRDAAFVADHICARDQQALPCGHSTHSLK